MSSNARWILGLVASVLVALSGQSAQIPEPYKSYIAIGGIIGTAITGYMVQRPREEWTEEKRAAVQKVEAVKEEAEVAALKEAVKKQKEQL